MVNGLNPGLTVDHVFLLSVESSPEKKKGMLLMIETDQKFLKM